MRIAHISDLHVLSLRGVHPLAFAGKRIVGAINLLRGMAHEYSLDVSRALIADLNKQSVDHVVVTGDISNLSLVPEFELAREILMGLSLPASEVTLIPGNHDCYTLDARLRDDFSRVLTPYLKGDLPVAAGSFPFVRLRGDVAIIALSTAHPSPPLFAVGTLGATQIRAAESLLQHPEVERRFRIVLLHHPPRSPHAAWHSRLIDGEQFIGMIERAGANLVLHGHLHRECRDQLPGPAGGRVPVIGINSSSWLAKEPARRASYNIYEIEAGEPIGVTRRVWRTASFVAA